MIQINRIKGRTGLIAAIVPMCGMMFSCNSVKEETKTSPNIIYIQADDLGYGDLSCFGQKTLSTPNIDQLASHYAGSAVCAPSRAVLMTGQHTGHAIIRGNKSIEGVGVAPLKSHIITTPEAIKNNMNYITAMCGRWHLGGELTDQTPYHRGFDYHFGKLSSDYDNKFGVLIDTLWEEKGQHISYEDYSKIWVEPIYQNGKLFNFSHKEMAMRPINMDELVIDKAIRFNQKEKDQPYFLYVAYSLVNEPMEYHSNYPVENTEWPEEARAFASMLMALDDYVGKIAKAVDESGQSDNSIIIFVSDNGPHNEGGH